MKIKTFNDFKNLKKGTWINDYNGTYEVVSTYREYNSCIGLAEVIYKDDESDEYTLGTENPNVTFLDVKGAEIISWIPYTLKNPPTLILENGLTKTDWNVP